MKTTEKKLLASAVTFSINAQIYSHKTAAAKWFPEPVLLSTAGQLLVEQSPGVHHQSSIHEPLMPQSC